MKYIVRLVGTSPVWADVEVEAQSPDEAAEKVEDSYPDFTAWQLLGGGNGVDDWLIEGVYDEQGDELLIDLR